MSVIPTVDNMWVVRRRCGQLYGAAATYLYPRASRALRRAPTPHCVVLEGVHCVSSGRIAAGVPPLQGGLRIGAWMSLARVLPCTREAELLEVIRPRRRTLAAIPASSTDPPRAFPRIRHRSWTHTSSARCTQESAMPAITYIRSYVASFCSSVAPSMFSSST